MQLLDLYLTKKCDLFSIQLPYSVSLTIPKGGPRKFKSFCVKKKKKKLLSLTLLYALFYLINDTIFFSKWVIFVPGDITELVVVIK